MMLLNQIHKICLFYWHIHLLCQLPLSSVVMWSPEVPLYFCSQTSGFECNKCFLKGNLANCPQLLLQVCTKVCIDMHRRSACICLSRYAHVLNVMHKLAELKPFLQIFQLACTHDALKDLQDQQIKMIQLCFIIVSIISIKNIWMGKNRIIKLSNRKKALNTWNNQLLCLFL